MLCTEFRCAGGHNEDSNLPDHELVLGFVDFGNTNVTILNYAGDLIGGMSAIAFNSNGFGFSLNYVGPPKASMDGLGRNFVSRLLLHARNADEAISIVSKKHIAGHN